MKRNHKRYRFCKDVLQQSPLFKGLDETCLDDMLTLFRNEQWERGAQQDAALFKKRFFLILQGRVELFRVNPETGKSITLFILGPGDGIDIVALLNTECAHHLQASALEPVSLISVPLKSARRWIEQHPQFNRSFLPYLGKQMSQMEELATDLALYDTMTRLARLILRNIVPKSQKGSDEHWHLKLIHDLHDEALARMVGSVRQVVNRHLQHWRKQGVLHRNKFSIEVDDLDRLEDFVNDASTRLEQNKKAG